MLFFERISLLVRTYHPAEGIDKQKILCGVNEFFIAMSHIQIYHSVFGIGPYDGEITEVHYIFDAQGIVLGREGQQNFHIFIGSRAGIPLIPFAGRCHKRGG